MPFDVVPPPGSPPGPIKLGSLALQAADQADIRGGRAVNLREFMAHKGEIKDFSSAAAAIDDLSVGELAVAGDTILDGRLGVGATPEENWSGAAGEATVRLGSLAAAGWYNELGLAISENLLWDGSDARYLEAAAATRYLQVGGEHKFQYAAAGANPGDVATLVDALTLSSAGASFDGDVTLAGDLTFSGTGRRILGDFSNSTIGDRVIVQTSTVNGNTVFGVMPNGTGNAARLNFWNSSDPDNSSEAAFGVTSSAVEFASSTRGTGSLKPMDFYVGGFKILSLTTGKVAELPQGQLKFPATQNASSDANTLDDYEEGTFTPTLAFGGASSGITYGIRTGFYTKTGNVVEWVFRIQLSSKGVSVGSATVTGYPFSCSNFGQMGVAYFAGLNITQLHGYVNSTTGSLFKNVAGNSTAVPNTDFVNSTDFIMSGSYRV